MYAERKERRYYVKGSTLPFGEDRRREFKGHRSLSHEEVPQRLMRTRRAVSRNLNGFLNTGLGGKAYLGVLDDGTVKGLTLSEAQKDHVRVSLEDLLNRYNPPVPKSRYRLQFVSVIGREEVGGGGKEREEKEEDSGVGMDGSEGETANCLERFKGQKFKGHLLRTSQFCWCDRDTRMMMRQGVSIPCYVVEILILPFTHDPTVSPLTLQLHPVYENELGKCYFRGSTSLLEYTYQQVAELTIEEARTHFERVKERLRQDMQWYMKLLTSALVESAKTNCQ